MEKPSFLSLPSPQGKKKRIFSIFFFLLPPCSPQSPPGVSGRGGGAHQALVVLPVDADPAVLDDDVRDLSEVAEMRPLGLAGLRLALPSGLRFLASVFPPEITSVGDGLDALRGQGQREWGNCTTQSPVAKLG